jgi:hypothetical protein
MRGLGRCRRATKQTLGAQVFIQVGPVYAIASTSHIPMKTLLDAGIQQAWISHQRDSDGATVLEIDGQRVLRRVHIAHALSGVRT